MICAINFGYLIISLLIRRQILVHRTSDFLGILSDCLVEPVATPALTEVCVCLIELAAMLPVIEVTLPRRPNFQHALPLSLRVNENPYSAEFSREIRQASCLSPPSRSLEKCCRLAFQTRSTGCETTSRPFEPGSIR